MMPLFVKQTLAIFVPPVGIVMLWASKQGILRKLLGTVALVVWSFVYLTQFFGMRFEVDGTGYRPIVSFEGRGSRYEDLEKSRETQPAPDVAPGTFLSGEYDWPRFRGPAMDGRYDGPVLTSWPENGLELLWKQPIGGGYASFVIAEGVAFTIEQRREREVVAAYELTSGTEIWTHGWPALFQETLGGDGPRATPTWDDGLVYALGATGELKVLDAPSGELLWERNILREAGAGNLTWGMSASPLIVDEKVIVLPGGSGGRSVISYNKVTGEELWSSLDDTQAYTSPILVTLAGRPQLVVVGARRVMGIDVEEGMLLWDVPWVTSQGINVAQPVIVDDNHVFLSAAYGHGASLIAITEGASASGLTAEPVWSNIRMKNKFTSSVLHEGYLYGLDEAILACVEAATGELQWKGGRYGYGQLVFASGHLVVLTERGELVLVEATPERHVEKATFQAIEGKTWNHPAIANGILLVRNADEMAAFSIAP